MNTTTATQEQTKVTVWEYYEVWDGSGWIGKNSNYKFNTYDEALEMINEFKADPRTHNPNMAEEYVQKWKAKKYTIQKHVEIITDIITI